MYILAAFSKEDLPLYRNRAITIEVSYGIVYFVVVLTPAEYTLVVLRLEPRMEKIWYIRGDGTRREIKHTQNGIACADTYRYMAEDVYKDIIKKVKRVYPNGI